MDERITAFLAISQMSEWYKATDLKPRTKQNYALRLMQTFDKLGIPPSQFLEECNTSRRQVLGRIKVALGELREHSASVAFQQRAALINFVNYYQDQFDEPITINSKIKVRRVRMKKELTFEQAQKIIAECSHPYREIFTLLLWSGMDQATFEYINENPKLIAEIQRQLFDPSRDFVRIDLQPRKSNTDVYFLVVPKFAFENLNLPVSTRTHKLRNGDVKGGKPISPMKLKKRWSYGLRRRNYGTLALGLIIYEAPSTLRELERMWTIGCCYSTWARARTNTGMSVPAKKT